MSNLRYQLLPCQPDPYFGSNITWNNHSKIKREQLLNCRKKLDHNISMIQEVFSSGIERGGTKRVATLILIVSFSPGVLHQRPIQAVHLPAESLYFTTLYVERVNATPPEYTCTQPQHNCTGVQQHPGQLMTMA